MTPNFVMGLFGSSILVHMVTLIWRGTPASRLVGYVTFIVSLFSVIALAWMYWRTSKTQWPDIKKMIRRKTIWACSIYAGVLLIHMIPLILRNLAWIKATGWMAFIVNICVITYLYWKTKDFRSPSDWFARFSGW